jgi:glycosyltransferase involved in cell wall biosynthesis
MPRDSGVLVMTAGLPSRRRAAPDRSRRAFNLPGIDGTLKGLVMPSQPQSSPAIRVSVVIPLRDEADSLEALHRELDAALASVAGGVEIIFVDDGSRDDSLARLRELARKDPRVRVITLDGMHGQSAALDAGFRAVRGEWTITLDADLQNDPADIPRLLTWCDRADVIGGVRVRRRDSGLRILSSRVANAVRNWLTDEQVSDVGCSLRVIRSDLLERVKLYRGMHRFLPTLLRLEGARVVEVPVSHRPRLHGRTKYGVGNRLWVGLVDLVAVRWMQSRQLRYRAREDGAPEVPSKRPI